MTDIIVSFSEVSKWQTCQRQYYYKFVMGLSPNKNSEAIDTGVNGHKFLEDFYTFLKEGHSKEKAWELATESAKKLINAGKFTDFTLLKAWTLVDNYIKATEFNKEVIILENRFLLPASLLDSDLVLSNVQIGFTPDVALQRKGGWVDVEDYKFVGRAWSKSKLDRFPQTKLYHIFLENMNYKISRNLIRFFMTDTAKVIEHPYDPMNDAEKATLIHDFMSGVKEVLRYKTQPEHLLKLAPRTMNYSTCQYCPFSFPCTLEARGKDATKTFAAEYKKSTYDYTR